MEGRVPPGSEAGRAAAEGGAAAGQWAPRRLRSAEVTLERGTYGRVSGGGSETGSPAESR